MLAVERGSCLLAFLIREVSLYGGPELPTSISD